MSDDMTKYSQQLRQLVAEYYHQQMTVDAYRAQRKLILDEIEVQFVGINMRGDVQNTAPLDSDV